MMKFIYTFCILAVSAFTCKSQDYLFEKEVQNYIELTDATLHWGGVENKPYTNSNFEIDPPIYFLSENDSIVKTGAFRGGAMIDSKSYVNTLYLFGLDNDSTPIKNVPFVSECSYKTEGEIGSRVMKMQFKNVVLEGYETEFLNYQIWYFEDSKVIEYHYGPNSLNGAHPYNNGALIISALFLENTTNKMHWNVSVYGNPENPQAHYNIDMVKYMNEFPVEGTVYRFYPNQTDISEHAQLDKFEVMQLNGELKVQSKKLDITKVTIVTIDGREIVRTKGNGKESNIDISHMNTGIYVVQIHTNEGVFAKKMMF